MRKRGGAERRGGKEWGVNWGEEREEGKGNGGRKKRKGRKV